MIDMMNFVVAVGNSSRTMVSRKNFSHGNTRSSFMKLQNKPEGTGVAVPFNNKGDDISHLTPEEMAERKRRILQAMRNYRVELANEILRSNPGLTRVQ